MALKYIPSFVRYVGIGAAICTTLLSCSLNKGVEGNYKTLTETEADSMGINENSELNLREEFPIDSLKIPGLEEFFRTEEPDSGKVNYPIDGEK